MELATAERTARLAPHRRVTTRLRSLERIVAPTLVAAHVAAVAWLVVGGGLYIDDVRAQAYAAGRTWWPFVIESNRTHLAPGARTVDWVMATYAPLEHWPAVAVTLGIALLLGWATVRLTARAVRHPLARAVGTFWVLFAASVLPSYAWFRQGLTTMLPLALVLLATSLLMDHLRTGRQMPWALAVGCHAAALTFSERALALPFVVLALLLVVRPAPDAAVRGPGRRLAAGVLTLFPFVALNLAFLATYASGEYDRAERSDPSIADAAVKLGRWFLVDLLPSFLGGPVRWRSIGPYSFADTPVVLVVVASAALLALLVIAVLTSGALRAALPVASVAVAYAVPVLAMVYVGRLAVVDDVRAVDDLRLLPDVSAAAAIALAALVGEVLVRSGGRDSIHRGLRRRGLTASLGAAVVGFTAASWVGFGLTWHTNAAGEYLANLRAGAANATGTVLPTPVPESVVPGWVDPAFTTAPLLVLVNPDVTGSEVIGAPQVVTASGELGAARLQRVADAPVPAGFCGQSIPAGQQSVTLEFDAPAPYYRGAIVQLGVLAGDATRIGIEVTDRDGVSSGPLVTNAPELLRGPHRVYALLPRNAAVSSVTVRVLTPNTAGVCITSARVAAVGAAG